MEWKLVYRKRFWPKWSFIKYIPASGGSDDTRDRTCQIDTWDKEGGNLHVEKNQQVL
jgi:hypothetical protein